MALDLDFRLKTNQPFYVFSVLTSADYLIVLPSKPVEIKHLGYTDDAMLVPSSSGDFVFIQSQTTSLANTLVAGRKLPLQPGESWKFEPNSALEEGADGKNEIKLRAVANHARMLIVIGGTSKVFTG